MARPRVRDEANLTPRQAQICALMASGKTRREVAEELGISPNTVNRLIERAMVEYGTKRVDALLTLVHRARVYERDKP